MSFSGPALINSRQLVILPIQVDLSVAGGESQDKGGRSIQEENLNP
jgi:hypothetical protein